MAVAFEKPRRREEKVVSLNRKRSRSPSVLSAGTGADAREHDALSHTQSQPRLLKRYHPDNVVFLGLGVCSAAFGGERHAGDGRSTCICAID